MNGDRLLCDSHEYDQHSLQFIGKEIPIFVGKSFIKCIEAIRHNFADDTKPKDSNECPKCHKYIENDVVRIRYTFRLRGSERIGKW